MRPIFLHPVMGGDGNNWREPMMKYVDDYCGDMDDVPMHFHLHFLHASEILGCRHPDPIVRSWRGKCYASIVDAMHLCPESLKALNDRLSM